MLSLSDTTSYYKFVKKFSKKYGFKQSDIFYLDDTDVVNNAKIPGRNKKSADQHTIGNLDKYVRDPYPYNYIIFRNEDELNEAYEYIYKCFVDYLGSETVERLRGIGPNFDTLSEPYKSLAIELKMTHINKSVDGLDSYASKEAMAYGNDFRNTSFFTILKPGIKKTEKFSEFIENKVGQRTWRINALREYIDDPNVLLIQTPGFNFLTSIDLLAENLQMTSSELFDLLTAFKRNDIDTQNKILGI